VISLGRTETATAPKGARATGITGAAGATAATGGATQGAAQRQLKHGRYTAEAIASGRWLRQFTRDVRALTKRLRQP
jgi:hypothetical protein